MASSIRPSDRRGHGGAKWPLRGQSLKDVQSLRMVQNHPPLTDDDDSRREKLWASLPNRWARRCMWRAKRRRKKVTTLIHIREVFRVSAHRAWASKITEAMEQHLAMLTQGLSARTKTNLRLITCRIKVREALWMFVRRPVGKIHFQIASWRWDSIDWLGWLDCKLPLPPNRCH